MKIRQIALPLVLVKHINLSEPFFWVLTKGYAKNMHNFKINMYSF